MTATATFTRLPWFAQLRDLADNDNLSSADMRRAADRLEELAADWNSNRPAFRPMAFGAAVEAQALRRAARQQLG